MERKAFVKENNSFWSIPGFSYIHKLILGRYNLAKNHQLTVLKKSSGFTLIELITVIGVISVLSVMGMAALDPLGQFQKSTDARKKSDLSQIQKAIEIYYEDNNRYPYLGTNGAISYLIKSNATDSNGLNWGDSWQPYMNILPEPPDDTTYVYYVDEAAGGQSYYLYASLSRGSKDSQACNNGLECQSAVDNVIPEKACGGVCNYGVSSANVNP
jgi:general secretion pathway protein G